MNQLLSIHWALISAIWYLANGMLHDIFVIKQHPGKYDRDLLRLLMDGHLLMLSGLILLVGYLLMLHKIQYGCWIGILIGTAMIIYCGMIFPFLKSFGTIFISLILIIISAKAIMDFPPLSETLIH